MRITTYIKGMMAAGLAVFLLSGCSSSSTATGLGLGVGGTWFGTLANGGGAAFSSFTMSLSQSSANSDDPFAKATLTGTFVASNNCIGSGTLTGDLDANAINLSISAAGGDLTLNGTAASNSMSGVWAFSSTAEDPAASESLENPDIAAAASGCSVTGGQWSATR